MANPTIYRYPRQSGSDLQSAVPIYHWEAAVSKELTEEIIKNCLLGRVPYTVSLEFPARATAEGQSTYEIEPTETDE
jgi:hypothetical protein